MPKWVRLWGKKRGTRLSGWWVVGSVSEAAFFGVLALLGVSSLTSVVTYQLFWPESTQLKVGFGFWLMVTASASFIVIGLTGFVLQLIQTLASPERRSALVQRAKEDHQRRAVGDGEVVQNGLNLPNLSMLTDSPGVRLAYRLAQQSGERTPIILATLFMAGWNSLLAILVVLAVDKHLRGNPQWFLTLLLIPFAVVSFYATRWFFRLFRRHAGIGPTAVEISDLPLLPGNSYRLYLCQYGRTKFKRLSLSLVGYEESIYQQGTDVRTERAEIAKISGEWLNAGLDPIANDLNAEPEKPLELDCQIRLPPDIMHSFHGQHNAVHWKIVVEGVASKWPSFCRSYPVAIYPRDVR